MSAPITSPSRDWIHGDLEPCSLSWHVSSPRVSKATQIPLCCLSECRRAADTSVGPTCLVNIHAARPDAQAQKGIKQSQASSRNAYNIIHEGDTMRPLQELPA